MVVRTFVSTDLEDISLPLFRLGRFFFAFDFEFIWSHLVEDGVDEGVYVTFFFVMVALLGLDEHFVAPLDVLSIGLTICKMNGGQWGLLSCVGHFSDLRIWLAF